VRALVTGTAGFIAGHLARRLVADGHEVTGLDLHPRDDQPFESVVADVRDAEALARLCRERRPELVFHLAAQASVSVSMREPDLDVEVNVLGTIRLAQAAAEAGARRFVFASTGGALFGQPEVLPASEDTPLQPASVYGASKLAAERYLQLLAPGWDLEVAVVRPANVYGPEQNPHGEAGVIAIFTRRMLSNEPVTIFGTGEDTRDYVYVDDIVEAFVRAADAQAAATALAGTGEETSTNRIFELTARAAGYERPPEHGPPRAGDIQAIALDASRARELWGWRPQVSLDDGIERTVDWFRETQGSAE
jgi:UDP-glucose 4-epimerase